jgi:hypothetical protein
MATQEIPPIARGYAYPLRVRVTGDEPVFPAGCALRADVRPSIGSPKLAGSLSTDAGTLVRIDDTTVELHLSAALTSAIENDSAVLDFARVDLAQPVWLGVQIKIPVIVPVTVV